MARKSSDPCNKAVKQFERGDLDNALNNIERCKKSIKKMMKKDPQNRPIYQLQIARVLRFEGQIRFSQKKYNSSEKKFSEAYSYLASIENTEGLGTLKGQLKQSLAILNGISGDMDGAIAQLRESKDFFVEDNAHAMAVEVLFQIADTLVDLTHYDQAIECYKEIGKVNKKVKDKKVKRLHTANGNLGMGKVHYALQDKKSARKYFTNAKKDFDKLSNSTGMAQSLLELAAIEEEEQPEKAEEMLLEARELSQMASNKRLEGVILTKLGVLSLKKGEFDGGKNRLVQSLKLRAESADTAGAASTLTELARITFITTRTQDDLENSAEFIQQALELYDSMAVESIGWANALELSCSIGTKMESYDSALSDGRKALKMFKKFGDKEAEARVLTQIGIILGYSNDPDVSTVLERAERIYSSIGHEIGIAEVKQILGDYYAKQKSKKSR